MQIYWFQFRTSHASLLHLIVASAPLTMHEDCFCISHAFRATSLSYVYNSLLASLAPVFDETLHRYTILLRSVQRQYTRSLNGTPGHHNIPSLSLTRQTSSATIIESHPAFNPIGILNITTRRHRPLFVDSQLQALHAKVETIQPVQPLLRIPMVPFIEPKRRPQ